MQDLLRQIKYRPKPYGYRLRIPDEYHREFLALLNKLVPYFRGLIEDIIKESGGTLNLPIDTEPMVKYLDGYTIDYVPFYDKSGEKPEDGHLEIVDLEAGVFAVFYNTYYPPKKQHATRIHETWHIFQLIDLEFRSFIDRLVLDTELPPDVIELILERATEKATFMYLIPNDYLKVKFNETQDMKKLSDYFQASEESLYYSIREAGLNYIK
jgi:hypothetical protein